MPCREERRRAVRNNGGTLERTFIHPFCSAAKAHSFVRCTTRCPLMPFLLACAHEHEQDGRQVDSFSGDHLVYVEANALQDADTPSKSGFSCLAIDPGTQTMRRYSFKWKATAYTAEVDGETQRQTRTPDVSAHITLPWLSNPTRPPPLISLRNRVESVVPKGRPT
jgi:hypothetical protein